MLPVVNCNRCGQSVAVGSDTRYVTCAHCRTPLVVIRTDSSAFTDVAARQKELERVDSEWEEEKRREHSSRDKNGNWRTPDEFLEPAIGSGILVVFTFFALFVMMLRDRRYEGLPVLVLLVVPFGLMIADAVRKARRYWRAESRYRARRTAIEHRPPDVW